MTLGLSFIRYGDGCMGSNIVYGSAIVDAMTLYDSIIIKGILMYVVWPYNSHIEFGVRYNVDSRIITLPRIICSDGAMTSSEDNDGGGLW